MKKELRSSQWGTIAEEKDVEKHAGSIDQDEETQSPHSTRNNSYDDEIHSIGDALQVSTSYSQDAEQQRESAGEKVTRIITGRSVASSWKDPGPPPDGGFKAWTQAIMGHLVLANTWGFIQSLCVCTAPHHEAHH